ncbi:MAG: hypothetical protein DRN96_00165 [Thermoproteota archaeon]|nr:MAG: hypothetical protein DRN96_00165 [Candidatus Korarchaeota archaeon]RLG55964.1 MAG: hypothetical protein DRN99_01075 [Candidatus Korarchaeota archaeon]
MLNREGFLRRVQLVGGSTLTISIPKRWASSVGLKPGDYVAVLPLEDDSLLLIPKGLPRKELTEKAMYVSHDKPPESAVREFIAYYLVGYDVIKVKFASGTSRHKLLIREAIRKKLIGVEPIEESAKELVVRCLIGSSELPVSIALNRMGVITSSMISDAVEALMTCNRELAHEIMERDDEVDRIYLYIVRQLKKAVRNRLMLSELGLSSARDCLGYRLVIKSVERSADHACKIAQIASLLRTPPASHLSALINTIASRSQSIFRDSLKSLMSLDLNLANETINRIEEVRSLEQKAIEVLLSQPIDIEDASNIRLALESLTRIAEYGADIAEIAVNLSVKVP